MAKARYDNKPLGHFGLNLDDYCHFTSPIRRYPDTAIHRILTGVAEGITVDRLQKKYHDFSREAAVLSSPIILGVTTPLVRMTSAVRVSTINVSIKTQTMAIWP